MANGTVKKPKPIKGIYERPTESGIWWINYYIEGRRFREKVGRRSDAVTLYQRRKTDARMGVKMPEVRLAVRFSSRRSRRMLSSTRRSTKPRTLVTARQSGSSSPSLARFPSTTLRRRPSKRTWRHGMISPKRRSTAIAGQYR
jgi:hypothetical protein